MPSPPPSQSLRSRLMKASNQRRKLRRPSPSAPAKPRPRSRRDGDRPEIPSDVDGIRAWPAQGPPGHRDLGQDEQDRDRPGGHVEGPPAVPQDRAAADPLPGPRREERVRRRRPRSHHRDAPDLERETRPGTLDRGEGPRIALSSKKHGAIATTT